MFRMAIALFQNFLHYSLDQYKQIYNYYFILIWSGNNNSMNHQFLKVSPAVKRKTSPKPPQQKDSGLGIDKSNESKINKFKY